MSVPPEPRWRLLQREPWLNASTGLIVLGLVMLMQPLSLTLFSYSFLVILIGTVAFTASSQFPE